MCGIAAIVGRPAPAPVELERMAGAMAHRGPDGGGTWAGDRCGLAFRRLAIIDLHERSNQPLHLGPLHLVFNGEIYNYRELREELRGRGHDFATEGDGEVLLHAWREWGEGALDRLNGMFAFAVWDEAESLLTAAVDPFGEKPLFWARSDERVLLASDVRALLAVDPALAAPREDALVPYLARGVLPPIEQSFFAGVERLPGAHVLRIRDGAVQTARYWSPRVVEAPTAYEDAVVAVRELLTDSVRLRLRSDVPVGTSLSGGVDSSAVVCVSAELAGDHRRHAFTARFPGFARDEWRYASAVAETAGVVEHHSVEPTGPELLDELETLVRFHEEPVLGTSVYAQWRVMRAAREAGVTVLLDGQGADELFGGYAGVPGWALRSEGPAALARGVARRELTPVEVATALGADRLRPLVLRRRRALTSPYVEPALAGPAAHVDPPPLAGFDGTPLRRELTRQALHTSMPGLLRYADRNSMAHSREVRLPFLDRRIAELALSLPPGFLYRDGVTKRVLRDAVRGAVPDLILDRRDKVGFETPEARWLSEPEWRGRIGEVLLDPGSRATTLLHRAAVEVDLGAGRWRDPQAIWRAVNLELWLKAFAAAPAHSLTVSP